MKKNYILFYSIIICLIGIGQAIKALAIRFITTSKSIIPNILNFTLIKNVGGAFGMGKGNLIILIILNIILILGILIYFMKLKDKNKLNLTGTSLILAGGISNLIDRIVRGYVVDYIDVNELLTYPVFNLEDMMIIIGIVIIGIYVIKKEKNEQIRSK